MAIHFARALLISDEHDVATRRRAADENRAERKTPDVEENRHCHATRESIMQTRRRRPRFVLLLVDAQEHGKADDEIQAVNARAGVEEQSNTRE